MPLSYPAGGVDSLINHHRSSAPFCDEMSLTAPLGPPGEGKLGSTEKRLLLSKQGMSTGEEEVKLQTIHKVKMEVMTV